MTIPIVHPFPCRKYTATRYPDGDVSTGSWTPTPVWQEIDDTSDADTVVTPIATTSPVTYTFQVSCENPTQTPGGAACQTLTYLARCRKLQVSGTGTVNVTVRLRQGGTTIATVSSSDIGTAFGDVSDVLTPGEYNNITDHNDLRIEVAATITADDGTYEIYGECSQARIVYS